MKQCCVNALCKIASACKVAPACLKPMKAAITNAIGGIAGGRGGANNNNNNNNGGGGGANNNNNNNNGEHLSCPPSLALLSGRGFGCNWHPLKGFACWAPRKGMWQRKDQLGCHPSY